ncbi:RNA-directed DNA polymerase (reversetranscriptase)-related family protein [Striga asiatica]|uniref:RNA-directed DNA polymerase (Reversetranscriptase)-related family protein n=1 Tax=Striga asiatica TaxID=4170 RepID=A0A5A7PYW7_STRAF|nr:RNA-directed DNA polymerase (reversetranscriptase)-related family protein [Striga asiatica]
MAKGKPWAGKKDFYEKINKKSPMSHKIAHLESSEGERDISIKEKNLNADEQPELSEGNSQKNEMEQVNLEAEMEIEQSLALHQEHLTCKDSPTNTESHYLPSKKMEFSNRRQEWMENTEKTEKKGPWENFTIRSNSSWLWKSWGSAERVLRKGLRIKIGDGRNTKIWNEPWIPSSPNFRLIGRYENHHNLEWVHQLMAANGREWNTNLIRSIFEEQDIKAILNTPLKNPQNSDKVVWHYDQKGNFSVKSAYNTFLKLEHIAKDTPESSVVNTKMRRMWRVTWGLKVKQKLKHFIILSYTETVLRAQQITASQDREVAVAQLVMVQPITAQPVTVQPVASATPTGIAGKRKWNRKQNQAKNKRGGLGRRDDQPQAIQQSPNGPPWYANCGRAHNGECLAG